MGDGRRLQKLQTSPNGGRLRENEFVGGKIKLGKLGTSLTGPGQGSIEDANNFVCESEK
jgi:hypothetical protein